MPPWQRSCHDLARAEGNLPSRVHPTVILQPGARLGSGVRVGPYCVVGEDVVLGDGVQLAAHVRVAGQTLIGAGTSVRAFVTLGATPQDLKQYGQPARLVIGKHCRIFEYAHLSGGTVAGGATSLGEGCLVMSHVHIGHDCVLGRGVVLAGSSGLAGHVSVGDGAIVSGFSCVHQHVAIGRGAFLAGASVLVDDLIPYGLAAGNRAQLHTLNLRGLRRQHAPLAEVRAMLKAYHYLFDLPSGRFAPLSLPKHRTLRDRAEAIDASEHHRLTEVIKFILDRRFAGDSGRGMCLPAASAMSTSKTK